MQDPNFPPYGQPPGGPQWPPPGGYNPYGAPGQPGARAGQSRSAPVVALILGIGSLVMLPLACCCGSCAHVFALPVPLVGIGLGVAGLIVANKELGEIRARRAPAEGEGMANAGKVCGIIGICLHVLAVVLLIVLLILGIASFALQPQGQPDAPFQDFEDLFDE